MSLPVSRLVQVGVSLSPQAAVGRNFGDLLIMGDSNVISGLERSREYSSLAGVTADFGVSASEALAAQAYFGQSPKPTSLTIGRWLRTATAAMLKGAILTAAQTQLALFKTITSGGFSVTVDGVVKALTGMDFSAALNLNGVATVIQTALGGSIKCVWTGSQFVITSGTTGAGVAASGLITLGSNPVNLDTVTVNGIVITFVTGTPTGSQVLIGGTAAQTAANLNTFLMASVSPNITAATYSVATNVVTVTYGVVGTGGNAFTLAKSSSGITISGSVLAGGVAPSSVGFATAPASGQDASALLGLTSAQALPLVPGYAAETALQAVAAMVAKSTAWYGLTFGASTMPSDADNLLIAPFIEAQEVSRMFGVTIQNTNVLSSEVTTDLASQLAAGGYEQSFCQYSSSNAYAVASCFGRLFTVDFEGQNTTIDLMYKQQPGIVAEALDDTQADTLKAKRCNVFVKYDNNTSILQYGVMSGPVFIDETYNVDWMQNALQTAIFNVNYTSNTKVPQTDQGSNQYVAAISKVCEQAVTNGVAAPGQWNSAGFGQLQEGQFLKLGYYTFAPPISSQSQSDREARKSVAFQTAVKFAGSTQTVDLMVTFNR